MAIPWDYFSRGDIVGPVKIIKAMILQALMNETEYLVEWTCCGTHEVMTHAKIRRETGKGIAMCKSCRGLAGFLKRGADYQAARPPPRPEQLGVLCNGHYWPALGKMGPRHDTTGRY